MLSKCLVNSTIRFFVSSKSSFKNAEIIWCQEEPENQGAWSFINPHIERNLIEVGSKQTRPKYVGRKAAAAPATGLASTHKKEQMTLIDQALTLKG